MHRAPMRRNQPALIARKHADRDPLNPWHGACDSIAIMKTIRSIFRVRALVVSLLSASAPLVIAQTVDTSTGTILDSNSAPSVVPPENPASTKLSATILPIEKGNATKGEAAFTMAGSAVSVIGRITGMEPNKRYQAVVWVPSVPTPSKQGEAVVNPSSEARPPAAESPPTGSPSPARPTSGQGSATAANRPPTAATEATFSPQSAELDLGTMVSDANGGANLNATLQNKSLTAPPTGILGGFIVIKRAPPLDGTDERTAVASGVIAAPVSATEAPAP